MPPLNSLQKTCLAVAISQTVATNLHASTIEVNNAGDNGAGCTLRDAITSFSSQTLASGCAMTAGTLTEPGTITFANSVANSTIALNGSELEVNNNADISIQGAGVTIDANQQSAILNVSDSSITIDSMTLTGGREIDEQIGGEGGEGTTINGSPLIGVTYGALTLLNCNISNNTTLASSGIISSSYADIDIRNSSINDNSSAGRVITSSNANTISFEGLTVNNNQSTSGTIDLFSNQSVVISNSSISNNSASNGSSGIRFSVNSSTSITNSTIFNNVTAAGNSSSNTLIFSRNPAVIANSTISGNLLNTQSSRSAGGIVFRDSEPVELINSTIANNTSPNILLDEVTAGSAANVSLVNSIIANAVGGSDCILDRPSISTITSDSNSIIEDGSCNTQARNVDPQLGPLADNGGPTLTHSLLSTSPAINTGNNATCQATDQRGETRPLSVSIQCDVGAFEVLDDDAMTFVIPLINGKTVIFDL